MSEKKVALLSRSRPYGCACRRSYATSERLVAHIEAGCRAYEKWLRRKP